MTEVHIPDTHMLLIPNESITHKYVHTIMQGYQTVMLPPSGTWFVGLLLSPTTPLESVVLLDINCCPRHRWELVPAADKWVYLPTQMLPNMNSTVPYYLQFVVTERIESGKMASAFVRIPEPPNPPKYYS